MPTGRAVLLLRRLSTGDSRLKNINLNQNSTKDSSSAFSFPVCIHRDLGASKRFSSYDLSPPTLIRRSFSDNIIKMATANPETNQAEKHKFSNRLVTERSPYLLQHAHNPVDWYPWCQEAIDRAKKENKLIFLSIGYSTCHWCHVMEKECFENEAVAKIMNEHYVNIKIDREERPDLDRVYMLFITATTGRGGWPMSIFLTPELCPVTGGTYFPPEDRWGRPGFKTILLSLANKWRENSAQFLEASSNVLDALRNISRIQDSTTAVPGEATWTKCVRHYLSTFEPDFGGFGTAPKFPQASIFNFLFHFYARDKRDQEGKTCLEMCLHTLTKIAKGGIHDHVSGGFARYSVDNDWHVPHFEKMLYDQAQLLVAYTDAYLATKDEFFAEVVRDIVKYINRDLRHETGGYYSAEDADSYPYFGAEHKKEGAFCTWEYKELKSLLEGKQLGSLSYFEIFCDYFSVQENGNISPESDPHSELTDKNVLIIYGSKEETMSRFGITLEQFNEVINECIGILFEARSKRPRPHLDTKMLCSWNGLMIAGLAQAGQGLGDKSFVDDALKTAQFVKDYLYDPNTKTLFHSSYRDEVGNITQTNQPIEGFLDDYAFLIKGLLDLYEASLDLNWLNWARELQLKQNELFWDMDNGGYFTTSTCDPSVILRLKEDQDGAEPSGNSVSCHNLQRLATYADKSAVPEGGDHERELAKKVLLAFSKKMMDHPTALPEMVSALMFYNDSPTQVLIAGGCSDPRTLELLRVVRSRLLPGRVLAVADPAADSPVVLSRIRSAGDVPAAYVCRRYACSLPVTDVKQLETLLDEPASPAPQNN
ncbi:spermatogenesis-associated protein 20 isoform X2 [Bicyclus anynana]|uniref:Spermatogenesis-associated protein 20 isoform X2 n=1 Tax=Bicyclus anynana TaxID=110368 RepID=A0A6J1NHI9_BICAN|nr:spermatogenesis-associated protein 20 isoform X2 [Bicyclus anynana]